MLPLVNRLFSYSLFLFLPLLKVLHKLPFFTLIGILHWLYCINGKSNYWACIILYGIFAALTFILIWENAVLNASNVNSGKYVICRRRKYDSIKLWWFKYICETFKLWWDTNINKKYGIFLTCNNNSKNNNLSIPATYSKIYSLISDH